MGLPIPNVALLQGSSDVALGFPSLHVALGSDLFHVQCLATTFGLPILNVALWLGLFDDQWIANRIWVPDS